MWISNCYGLRQCYYITYKGVCFYITSIFDLMKAQLFDYSSLEILSNTLYKLQQYQLAIHGLSLVAVC